MANNAQSHIKYAKKKLKRIPLDVQLEMFEKWKNAAKMAGIPLNTLIKSAVNEKIENLEKSLDFPIDSDKRAISEDDRALLDSLSD